MHISPLLLQSVPCFQNLGLTFPVGSVCEWVKRERIDACASKLDVLLSRLHLACTLSSCWLRTGYGGNPLASLHRRAPGPPHGPAQVHAASRVSEQQHHACPVRSGSPPAGS